MSTATPAKRIVLATFGSPGDLRPFLAIGRELRARGHNAVVATSELYRDQVVAAGLDFAPVRPNRLPGQQDPDFFARLLRDRQPPATIFRQMFLPSLREALQDTVRVVRGADGVVAHTLAASARLAAEVNGTPWVSVVMQPMGYFSAYEPPVVGPPSLMAVLRHAGPVATKQVLRVARGVTDAWAREWREVRAELALPPSDDHPLWEGQHAPDLSLGIFPRILGEPQPDWPAQARVTGFPFYESAADELDPALERFLAMGAPPIVFTLGTTAVNEPGHFYEISARAARELGCRAVLVADGGVTPRSTAEGIITIPFAPHRLLFPRAVAVVHQGGIGTLAEALRAGNPMLIMPYAHDQADNAWRAERLGVATVIARRRYRVAAVRRALGALLANEEMRVAAALAARRMNRDRGAARAAELIDAALGPGR